MSDAAFAFARDSLWLARDFEAPLAATLAPERWRASGLAGTDTPVERLERFTDGGVGARPVHVADVVLDALREAPGATFVAVDGMGRAGDAFLARVEIPYILVRDTIVYPVPEPDRERVARVWDATSTLPSQVALLTAHAPSADGGDPAAMIDAATLVIFGAYDGEGAIVFRRRSRALTASP